ncbi:MAG: bifunctional phosphoserine phosphatase/homoserine phosphotransferase ThrH [Lentisphaeria bacterium]|nr:bifunctional phosphoserine phosphatase/homoserine phosphotransferase ThrH [Lentisphaeria bacterium]
MPKKPLLVAMDLEGVLVPEIWIAVAEKTGIEKLRLTTRDVSDYDELMRGRLDLLAKHGLTIEDIQAVIASLEPLPGALELLTGLRERFQVIILSDTFYEFAAPLMAKLGWPALFCNYLDIDADGAVTGYRLRKKDGKREAVKRFKELNFDVVAVGDSYNDTTMLGAAHLGILFRPSANVKRDFPQYSVAEHYEDLDFFITEFCTSER